MTPFMISSLGDHSYGLWMLVASFSGFYGLLDIGLATAVQRYLSKALGTNDYKEANIIFNTSLIVFLFLGLISLLAVFGLSCFSHTFVKSAADAILFKKIIILLGIVLCFGFPMRSFWAIFSCHLRLDIGIYLGLLNLALKTILIIVFFKKGYGILALTMINLLCDFLNYFLTIIFSLKLATYIKISIKYFDKTKIRTFLNYSIFSFISKIAGNIRFNVDNFVISAFIGLNPITLYSIAIRLSHYYIRIISDISGLTPVFSQYEATNDYDSIRKYFLFGTKINVFASSIVGSLLIILGRQFIILWVGEDFSESYNILLLFVIPFAISLAQRASGQLMYGISKHKFLTIINVIESIANLILSIILVQSLGLKGVALGTAIPLLFMQILVMPLYTCKIININVASYYFKTLLFPFSQSAIIILSLWLLFKTIPINNYFSLISMGFLYSTIFIITIFFLGFTKEEQITIINALPVKILNIITKVVPWIKKLKY